jgi:spore coat protein CotH
MVLLLALSCSRAASEAAEGAGGGGGDAVGSGGAGPGDGATFPKPCADLYDPDVLQRFDIEMAAKDWDAMVAGCQEDDRSYRPITLRYGEEVVPAMIRLKGNWSWSCNKMQFVISFNETDRKGRFRGLRKLVLDAPWYDHSLLRERVAFSYMRDLGVPSSCANSARVYVNGNYYGLYTNVERLDREYLERNFALPDGNLYEEGRELKTNEATGDTASVDAFWAASSVADLEQVVDLQHAVDVWAGLAMLPDADSYWAGVEINFFLYQHPTRGLLFLPYDMDIAMSDQVWADAAHFDPITQEHPDWGKEPQFRLVLDDPQWCSAYEDALRRARQAYDVAALEQRIDAWASQIAVAVSEDPHKEFSLAEHQASLDALRTFPRRRAAFVDAWLARGGHCPPRW